MGRDKSVILHWNLPDKKYTEMKVLVAVRYRFDLLQELFYSLINANLRSINHCQPNGKFPGRAQKECVLIQHVRVDIFQPHQDLRTYLNRELNATFGNHLEGADLHRKSVGSLLTVSSKANN
jgi:hypothetical protein